MKNTKKTLKKISLFAVLLTLLSFALGVFAYAEEESGIPDLSHTKYVYLYNRSDRAVVYEKNSTEIIAPGPTVKLMTAAVVIDCLGDDLNREITVRGDVIEDVYGNNINLQDGEVVTVLQLLNALIIGNSNDAALVLAHEACGSVGAFVIRMNEKAQEIGAVNTVYSNPTGLEEGTMTTTAEDVCKIAQYLCLYDIFTEITDKASYVIPETNKSGRRTIFSRNYFINTETEYKYYSPYVNGMTAGSTENAGYCVVASSVYNNTSYICVVMGSEKDDEYIYSFRDCGLLLNWAYKSFAYKNVLSASEVITTLPVKLASSASSVAVMPENGIDLYLAKDESLVGDITLNWNLNCNELTAPVESGTVVGKITVLQNGKIVAQTNLVVKTDIPRSELLYYESGIAEFLTTGTFRIIVFLLALIIALAIVLAIRKKRLAEKEAMRILEAEQRRRLL